MSGYFAGDEVQVTIKRLNKQVRRNRERFPEDFVFQLSQEEHEALRSHFATSYTSRGGRRYLPYVFTERRAIMNMDAKAPNRSRPFRNLVTAILFIG